VVVVAGLAGAADDVGPAHGDADGGRGRPASSLGIDGDAVVAIERGGARFVWPDLDAPCYADPAAAVERLALKGWRQGGMTPDAPATHTSPAGRYLAADVTYLRTLMGQMAPLDAVAAYDRALRADPDFADAPRALVMIGFASLRLGLAPEADTAFRRAFERDPHGRYARVAQLGRAAALRERHRWDEARTALASLAEPPAGLRCEVLAERAALARATGRHDEAAPIDVRIAAECPAFDALPATAVVRVESLLALGRRAEARALLASPVEALDVEARADQMLRAGELAREDGDLVAARAAFERALGLRVGPGQRTSLRARIARLDALVSLDRGLAALEALAMGAPSAGVRADVVGVAAETLADAGRYDDALARLAVPDDATPAESDATLARADALLARWFARLEATHDVAGIVTLYAKHRTVIDTHADGATARRIADALARMALPEAALRLLRLRDRGDDPTHGLAVVRAALEAGEPVLARDALARLAPDDLAPPLRAERARLAAAVAAASGRLEAVADDAALAADAPLARRVARAWMERGDAAMARGARDEAAAAYDRGRVMAPDAADRAAAAAALTAARAEVTPAARDELAAVDDPVVRRALALVDATSRFGATVTPQSGGDAATVRSKRSDREGRGGGDGR